MDTMDLVHTVVVVDDCFEGTRQLRHVRHDPFFSVYKHQYIYNACVNIIYENESITDLVAILNFSQNYLIFP